MTTLPLPAQWEIMPFRFLFGPRANLAILLTLFVVLIGFGATLAGTAKALGYADPRSLEIYKLIGLTAAVAGILAMLIRQQASDNYLHESKHETLGAIDKVNRKADEIRLAAGVDV